MPERSFGRVVRYRRTKLGLSQAKLAQLVGRSPATVRSWESEKSVPNDPKVLSILSAILGVDERTMFNKAGQEPTMVVETSPTVEEALASLAPEGTMTGKVAAAPHLFDELAPADEAEQETQVDQARILVEDGIVDEVIEPVEEDADLLIDLDPREAKPAPAEPAPAPTPSRVSPPPSDPFVIIPSAVPIETSYVEDSAQRQLYRVRTLATVVGLVALVVALLWAAGEGLDALGVWWDDFIGTLRL
jgi:transcriptional regulator with XRE-family HTH domain